MWGFQGPDLNHPNRKEPSSSICKWIINNNDLKNKAKQNKKQEKLGLYQGNVDEL